MTGQTAALPPDDLSRTVTIVHADNPGLTHLGVGAGTYTPAFEGYLPPATLNPVSIPSSGLTLSRTWVVRTG